MKKFIDLLIKNWPLKLASILIACLIWLMVVQIADPEVTARFKIPLNFINENVITDAGLAVTENNNKTVSIRVTGNRSVINKLSETDFIATADFSNAQGNSKVPVTVKSQTNLVSDDDIELEDKSVDVTIEKIVKLQSDLIKVEHTGELAEGYVLNEITISPEQVTIYCPESKEELISKSTIKAIVNVSGISEDKSLSVKLSVFDSNGNELKASELMGVTMSDDGFVNCEVKVSAKKSVSIEVKTRGYSYGHSVTKVEASLDKIDVVGEKSALDKIDSIVIDDISITGHSKTFSKTVSVNDYLPRGVEAASEETIKVTVTIS